MVCVASEPDKVTDREGSWVKYNELGHEGRQRADSFNKYLLNMSY